MIKVRGILLPKGKLVGEESVLHLNLIAEVLHRSIPFGAVAMTTEELVVLDIIPTTFGLRDDVVDLKVSRLKLHSISFTFLLLFFVSYRIKR